MDQKSEQVYRAKIAEQAERYEDMVEAMKSVVEMEGDDLNQEERNLLSVAYKNVVGARRSSWRIISSLEKKEQKSEGGKKAELAEEYRRKVEEELKQKCCEVLDLIDKHLLPEEKSNSDESLDDAKREANVFYLKMKGDYFRYLVEIEPSDSRDEIASKSKKAYEGANEAAKKLASTHPIRLGLMLNFSVFHYEIQNDPKEACELAKKAFDDAIGELDRVEEESYKDSTLIMQLLRDNLTLWQSEREDEQDGD